MAASRRWIVAVFVLIATMVGAYLLDLTPSRAQTVEVVNWARYTFAPPVDQPQPVPRWARVYVIVLENRDYHEIIGADDAPFLNALAARGAVAINTWDVAGGSQPNYFAMTSGDTHFVTDNGTYDIEAPSLFDQLESASQTWRVFAEHVPPGCFTGASVPGGEGRGEYVRAHNPAISFTSIRESPERCANIQDHRAFDPLAANFQLIVPDSCNNTHDCPVSTGDRWLSRFVPAILETPTFWDDSLLIITFDGGSDAGPDDGHRIAVTMVGAGVRAGTVSRTRYNHYNVLRTVQEGLGLPCLARSCKAGTMSDLFLAQP